MDPLVDFICWRRDAPYFCVSGYTGRRVKVFPVRSKTGLVASRRSATAHLDAGVAATLERGRLRYGARFMCGGGSYVAGIIPDAKPYGGICAYCVDAVAGPGVYRCFNSFAALIYIGSAERVLSRLDGHKSRTPWWPEVADVQTTRYPTIFEARAAERLAINAESPLYNKAWQKRGAA